MNVKGSFLAPLLPSPSFAHVDFAASVLALLPRRLLVPRLGVGLARSAFFAWSLPCSSCFQASPCAPLSALSGSLVPIASSGIALGWGAASFQRSRTLQRCSGQ